MHQQDPSFFENKKKKKMVHLIIKAGLLVENCLVDREKNTHYIVKPMHFSLRPES